MSAENKITPEVLQHGATVDSLRVDTNANLKYHHNFWSSYKGHVRGMLTGTTLGTVAGAAIGVALIPFVGPAAIPLLAGAGLLFGAEETGSIGASTGARASGLAEKHARILDPANADDPLKANQDKLLYGGNGQHYEYPPDRDKGKLFSLKSGLTGAAIGTAAGALMTVEVPMAGTALATFLGIGSVAAAPIIAPVLAGALVFGLFGLSFGVERNLFKSVFNKIGELVSGKPRDTTDIGREQALAQGMSEDQLLERRLQRQEDVHHLQDEYDKKIFLNGAKGYIKGMAGGSIIGIAIGVAAGALAAGILAVAGVTLAPLAVISVFAAGFGAYFGKTFAEAGKEAGTESAARAIDDDFEHRQLLKAQGIEPPPPQKAESRFFSPKVAATMGIVGAATGAALAPVLAPILVPSLATGAALTFGLSAVTGTTLGISAIAGGILGASLGFGSHLLGGISNISRSVYTKTYAGNDEDDPAKPLTQKEQMHAAGHGTVTLADARNLEARLNANAMTKNYADDIIAQQQIRQAMPAAGSTLGG